MCIFSDASADNLSNYLIGNSPAMKNLRAEIIAAARWNYPVIIEGESGTGKDLVANLVFCLWKQKYDKKGPRIFRVSLYLKFPYFRIS